jgi:Fur family peroxide stress response transcriptional regulator
MANKSVIKILAKNDLKVTPQRIAILEVILTLNNHPDADIISEYLRLTHPNISRGTIYKTLEIFTKKGIIKKVPTTKESMRYDAIPERHHHLYCSESDRIEDFYDDELNKILEEYMKKKNIPNFKIEDMKLQILGKFKDNKLIRKSTK